MSAEQRVYRLKRNGPAGMGLARMELDPADFQSALPEQFIHSYFEDDSIGLTVGVWTTTSMQEAFGPYPGDEFMCILEGQVAMLDGEGNEVTVSAGQAFCIRNAIPVSWKQVGFLRKFYMTYLDPNASTPEIDSAANGVIVLDPAKLEKNLQVTNRAEPITDSNSAHVQRDSMAFTNDAGNMVVGMWDSTAFESEMKPFGVHEFVQLLEGDVTILEGDGTAHLFTAGDAFFIPKGTVCQWKATQPIKKFYSILD